MTIEERVNQWTASPFDDNTINEIKELQKSPADLEDAFYKDIAFGTGGMRGIMGVGTNRINRYTLGKASQGLANFLNKQTKDKRPKIVIAYDCRNNSRSFANSVAEVFSANQIDTYLFSSLRPTPLLSFAVRHLGAQAGIVLTASHNPPEYNGYKVYNQQGGQIVPPDDTAIMKEIESVDFSDILWQKDKQRIHLIDQEIDEAYTTTIIKESFLTAKERKNTSVVFTPLHGTSIISLPPVLDGAGYEHIHIIKEQEQPNGNFPTVVSPNPEEPEAFTIALAKAKEIDADIVLGTDPDADRIGIGLKDNNHEWILLNGNQLMVVLTRFVLEQSKLSPDTFIASTIVSTPLMTKLAEAFNIECKLGLTGFKWIGKMIEDFPDQKFLCGGEESYGFLLGDEVRDKDAISAALLACDLHAHMKAKGSSIYDYLLDTYLRYGCFQETLVSETKKGRKGAEQINQFMHRLREETPLAIGHYSVVKIEDFLKGIAKDHLGEIRNIELPKANVLKFHLSNGATVAIRPSGTEPKIKFYFSVNAALTSIEDYPSLQKKLIQQCEELMLAVNQL
jgi:phosphoglucomutase